MLFNIVVTLFFVLLNAFFVAAEFSIVKVRSTQIEIKRRKGSFPAKVALHLVSHLNEYLSACQLGITIASLGLGWIGEPVVSKIFLSIFQALDLDIGYDAVEKISLPFAFVTITILHIVLGELAPKSIAILKAEKVSLFVAIPLRIFFIIFKPFIWVLNEMSNLILKTIGIKVEDTLEIHTEEELKQIVKSSLKFGNIELGKEKLLQNVFDFSQITVKQVMVPRNKIVAVDKGITLEQMLSRFESEGYSRIPVYDTTIDDIIGIVYAKDLLLQMKAKTGEKLDILKIIRKPLFVKETQKIHEVLKIMQKEKVHLAIVIDEFGGTAGLLTIEDILEELVGEIQDEFDEEQPLIRKLSNTEFELSGITTIDEIVETLNIDLPKSKEYETIGGLVSFLSGRIPQKGERFYFDQFYIEVVSANKRIVEKLRIVLTSN